MDEVERQESQIEQTFFSGGLLDRPPPVVGVFDNFRHASESEKGSARSGNYGHAGRPGKRGGSSPRRQAGVPYAKTPHGMSFFHVTWADNDRAIQSEGLRTAAEVGGSGALGGDTDYQVDGVFLGSAGTAAQLYSHLAEDFDNPADDISIYDVYVPKGTTVFWDRLMPESSVILPGTIPAKNLRKVSIENVQNWAKLKSGSQDFTKTLEWQDEKGSAKSGNYGHAGRPGKRGGSSPKARAGIMLTPPNAESHVKSSQLAGYLSRDVSPFREDYDNDAEWFLTTHKAHTDMTLAKGKALSKESGETPEDCLAMCGVWTQTSGNEDMYALTTQMDAADEFELPVSNYINTSLNRIKARGGGSYGHNDRDISDTTKRNVMRTMYNQTQGELRKAGIGPDDKVTLFRGVRDVGEGGRVPLFASGFMFEDNPLSSWTLHKPTADYFGKDNDGVTITAAVPARSILSIPTTGFGTFMEAEVVVLGAQGYAKVIE